MGEMLDQLIIRPETGEILRKKDPSKIAGYIKPGTKATGGGYRMISLAINGKRKAYRAHQLIWLAVHGEWPKGQIDHKNGKRDDNRISNLRLATISQNRTNKAIQSNNRSGFKWVRFCTQRKLWCAEIAAPKFMKIGRRRLHSSFHSTPEAAYEAACISAKKIYGEWYNPGENYTE